MRALIQRVKRCSVTIDGSMHSAIGPGVLVLLGVKQGDQAADAEYLADRCAALRIFEDAQGKMNLSVKDVGGSVMVVSQFTLYGDTRKGNRPSYSEAAAPESAELLYDHFAGRIKELLGAEKTATGVFRAMMNVELVNDGPVTVMVESKTGT
ncbi:MAG: D-aminoacyl-tRNA deacylase [Ignavibacteriales bacterium]|nr:D-aminoacyl-tRNA deacylase [Ignavibacteriales bacterium]